MGAGGREQLTEGGQAGAAGAACGLCEACLRL